MVQARVVLVSSGTDQRVMTSSQVSWEGNGLHRFDLLNCNTYTARHRLQQSAGVSWSHQGPLVFAQLAIASTWTGGTHVIKTKNSIVEGTVCLFSQQQKTGKCI